MSEAKHTPGPWRVETDSSGQVYTDHASDWLFGANNQPVIHTFPGDYEEEARVDVSDYDARLIAAAPDLLNATNALLSLVTGNMEGECQVDCDPLEIARDAIAKAEGRS